MYFQIPWTPTLEKAKFQALLLGHGVRSCSMVCPLLKWRHKTLSTELNQVKSIKCLVSFQLLFYFQLHKNENRPSLKVFIALKKKTSCSYSLKNTLLCSLVSIHIDGRIFLMEKHSFLKSKPFQKYIYIFPSIMVNFLPDLPFHRRCWIIEWYYLMIIVSCVHLRYFSFVVEAKVV